MSSEGPAVCDKSVLLLRGEKRGVAGEAEIWVDVVCDLIIDLPSDCCFRSATHWSGVARIDFPVRIRVRASLDFRCGPALSGGIGIGSGRVVVDGKNRMARDGESKQSESGFQKW